MTLQSRTSNNRCCVLVARFLQVGGHLKKIREYFSMDKFYEGADETGSKIVAEGLGNTHH